MTPEKRLELLGIELPVLPEPLGSYVPFVRAGNLIYISGMLPVKEGKLIKAGRVGETVNAEEATVFARIAAINALSVLRSAAGSLNNVKRCVKITGYIASANDFTGQPGVLNGASDLMFDVFGEAGKHARAAIGVNVLPLNSPLEIEFIFEIQ